MAPDSDPTNGAAQLHAIAHGSVKLAGLVPHMAELAEAVKRQAREQAEAAAAAAETSALVAASLETAVRELGQTSGQMTKALLTVQRIADHTKILSINASIEASRAGSSGRAFGVVVDEVKQLAETTTQTTRTIEAEVAGMQERVARVAAATGFDRLDEQAATLGAMNRRVNAMAQSARRQLESAESLYRMGERIEGLAENLLLSVGRFRFAAHEDARDAMDEILPKLRRAGLSRANVESILSDWLARHPYFELAYATDAAGRQFIDNLSRTAGAVHRDAAARGKVWAERPWYREACQAEGVTVTDLYRSAATREFCFTVAAAWRSDDGAIVGVVAADVNFHKLMMRHEPQPAASTLTAASV